MSTKTTNRWAILVGVCIVGVAAGLQYAWSLFVHPICDQYGWDIDQVAMMGNVMMACFCAAAMVAGNTLPKLGSTKQTALGSVMFGGGFIISAFVNSPIIMYFTYGVLAGFGAGVLYVTAMFTATQWFPDHKGLATGIYTALFGFTPTLAASPITSMLNNLGVKATLLYLGIGFIVVLGIITVFLVKNPPKGWLPAGYVPPETKASGLENLKSLTRSEGFKTKEFWFYCIAVFMFVMPYSFISSYVTVFVSDYCGFTLDQAVSVVAAMGIGAVCGRFLGGILLDGIGSRMAYIVFGLVSVLACAMMLFCQGSYVALWITFVLISAGYGGRTPAQAVIPGEVFGPENASGFYGFGAFAAVFSSLLGPAITALTRSSTGSFTITTIVAIACAAIGTLCIAMISTKHTPYMKKNGITSLDQVKEENSENSDK